MTTLDLSEKIRATIVYDKFFVISIEDLYGESYNSPEYFSVSIVNSNMMATPTGEFVPVTNTDIAFHTCQPEDFPGNFYYDGGFAGTLCLNNSFMTNGYWNQESLWYLDIQVYMCDNATTNGKCKSMDEIQAFLSQKQFNLYLCDLSIDPTNYESPLKQIVHNDYYFVDTTLRKTMAVFLKTIQMSTDDAYVFSNNKVLNDIVFDYKEEDSFFVQDPTDNTYPVFECEIYSSSKSYFMTRVYEKLSQALANIGGMASFHIRVFCYKCYKYL